MGGPVPDGERVSPLRVSMRLCWSPAGVPALLSQDELSESEAAAVTFFLITSVLTVGLGARLEKVPRAADATSTSPVGEAPYWERDLLLFEPVRGQKCWIQWLTPLC